jgi:Tfp pilus assembly protein PilF
MGICQFLQGNAPEARKLMERAVVHLPNDPALLVTLANLDLQEGRAVEAEARLRTVLAADNADTEALFVLVSALQLQGRTDEAATTLDDFNRKREIVDRINDLLKDKADNPASSAAEYAEIGNLFAKIGRDKLSVYWLEQALQRDARCQTAHRGLAEHYERKGDAATAAIHRRQLTTPDPKPVGSPVEKKP